MGPRVEHAGRNLWLGRCEAGLAAVLETAVILSFLAVLASILRVDTDDLRSALSGGSGVKGAAVAQAPTGETEVTVPAAPTSFSGSQCPVSTGP